MGVRTKASPAGGGPATVYPGKGRRSRSVKFDEKTDTLVDRHLARTRLSLSDFVIGCVRKAGASIDPNNMP